MKYNVFILILLFIYGCSSYDASTVKILNSQKIQGITSWKVTYDSSSGYTKSNSLIENETSYTAYLTPGSPSDVPSPVYKYSEIRGKKLSDNIQTFLSDKGVKLSDESLGQIIIYRPTFLDEGRYILHTYVTIFDKDNNKLAELDIFNNCIQRNSTKGIHYDMAGDILDDNGFAAICADKIFDVLNQ